MSLLKLSFLLSSAIGIHVVFTPPHTPSQDEVVAPTFREWLLNANIGTFTRAEKFAFWIAVLGEAATIILPLVPSSKLPNLASTILAALGGPDKSGMTPMFLAGSIIVSLGGLLRWQCYRTLGRFFTFQLSLRHGHRLVTKGPYSIVRHPSYTAVALSAFGAIIMYSSSGCWLRSSGMIENVVVRNVVWGWVSVMGATVLGLLKRCPKEDQMLKQAFGKEWEEWASRVKYKLIPGLY